MSWVWGPALLSTHPPLHTVMDPEPAPKKYELLLEG